MNERSYLSIGDVLGLLREEFPDITISKIRFLESRGLLVPERTPSGYRKFYDHDVDRLRWILRQQREHFLPLKVIKGRLEGSDTGEAPALFPVEMGEPPPGVPEPCTEAEEHEVAASAAERQPALVGRSVSGHSVHSAHAAGHSGLANGAAGASPRPTVSADSGTAAHSNLPHRQAAPSAEDRSRSGDTARGTAGTAGERVGFAAVSRAGGPPAAPAAAAPAAPGSAMPASPAPAASAQTPSARPAATAPPAAPQRAASAQPGAGAGGSAAGQRPSARAPEQAPASARSAPSPVGQRAPVATASTAADRPGAAPAGAALSPSPAPEVGADDVAAKAAAADELSGASLTVAELAQASGLDILQVEALESFGLIVGRTVAGVHCFDEDALVVAGLAAGFAAYGVEARHLRLFKHAAERQVALYSQVVLPLLRQRNPEARRRALEELSRLAELGARLQGSFARGQLRDLTGG